MEQYFESQPHNNYTYGQNISNSQELLNPMTMKNLLCLSMSVIMYLLFANTSLAFNNYVPLLEIQSEFHTTYESEKNILKSDCPILKRKCKGTIQWKNGDQYKGAIRFGKPHGHGTYTWSDGTTYKGLFDTGVPHGFGKKSYIDGSVYEGEWWNGMKHGKGAYSFSCGDEYFGEFQDDLMEGEGTILFGSGESYSGNWKENQPDGYGIFSRNDGSQYAGNSHQGMKDGEGMIIWETGDTLQGNWVEGKLEDDATFIFNDGSTMISFWENGETQEELTYITSEGDEYTGNQKELASVIITQDFDRLESVENNLQLAYYIFAMEYKSNQQFGLAQYSLQLAMSFDNSELNPKILEMVNDQMANIKSEQEDTGVASSLKN